MADNVDESARDSGEFTLTLTAPKQIASPNKEVNENLKKLTMERYHQTMAKIEAIKSAHPEKFRKRDILLQLEKEKENKAKEARRSLAGASPTRGKISMSLIPGAILGDKVYDELKAAKAEIAQLKTQLTLATQQSETAPQQPQDVEDPEVAQIESKIQSLIAKKKELTRKRERKAEQPPAAEDAPNKDNKDNEKEKGEVREIKKLHEVQKKLTSKLEALQNELSNLLEDPPEVKEIQDKILAGKRAFQQLRLAYDELLNSGGNMVPPTAIDAMKTTIQQLEQVVNRSHLLTQENETFRKQNIQLSEEHEALKWQDNPSLLSSQNKQKEAKLQLEAALAEVGDKKRQLAQLMTRLKDYVSTYPDFVVPEPKKPKEIKKADPASAKAIQQAGAADKKGGKDAPVKDAKKKKGDDTKDRSGSPVAHSPVKEEHVEAPPAPAPVQAPQPAKVSAKKKK